MKDSKNLIVTGDLTPVLSILKEEDAQTLLTLRDELVDTWSKKQLFRTETEMRVSVLDDIRHPTNASKYWQAVREQSGMFENIIRSSFEIRRNKIKYEKLFRKLENTTDDLQRASIEVNIDENLYDRALLEQTAKDRIRELQIWSQIKSELDDKSFDNQNVNTHQAESLHLRLLNRARGINEHTDINEVNNIVGPLVTAERLKEQGKLPSGPMRNLLDERNQ
tara:strand:+ start:913 stop:1578 length:666 start_codon:yes stop_codon:yes gene_type:complete